MDKFSGHKNVRYLDFGRTGHIPRDVRPFVQGGFVREK